MQRSFLVCHETMSDEIAVFLMIPLSRRRHVIAVQGLSVVICLKVEFALLFENI
jgi:hypothetical protein